MQPGCAVPTAVPEVAVAAARRVPSRYPACSRMDAARGWVMSWASEFSCFVPNIRGHTNRMEPQVQGRASRTDDVST